MNRNEELIEQARAAGAPEYLLDFMRAYPHHVPIIGFIATAYQQYVALPIDPQ